MSDARGSEKSSVIDSYFGLFDQYQSIMKTIMPGEKSSPEEKARIKAIQKKFQDLRRKAFESSEAMACRDPSPRLVKQLDILKLDFKKSQDFLDKILDSDSPLTKRNRKAQKLLRDFLAAAEKSLELKELEYLDEKNKAFADDGGINPKEANVLAQSAQVIEEYRAWIADIYAKKLGEEKEFDALDVPGANVPADKYQYGEIKKYEDFYTDFEEAVLKWTNNARNYLNAVAIIANKSSSNSSFKVSSLAGIVTACFKISSIKYQVAAAIATLIAAELEDALTESGDGDTVDAGVVNLRWQTQIDKFTHQPKLKELFGKFIESWKKQEYQEWMQVPGDPNNEYIGDKIFGQVCKTYPDHMFPTFDDVKKRFLMALVDSTKNRDMLEDSDEAGDAELRFYIKDFRPEEPARAESPWMPEFVLYRAQLDDVSSGLLVALKEVYGKSTPVYELPVLINAHVYTASKQHLFSVKRKIKKARDKTFKLESGAENSNPLEFFMWSRMLERVTVGDLKYDD